MVERLKGKKLIGIKQSTKAIRNGEGKVLYIANDADSKILVPLIETAKEQKLEVKYIKSMKELGKMCGIEVGCAATLVL